MDKIHNYPYKYPYNVLPGDETKLFFSTQVYDYLSDKVYYKIIAIRFDCKHEKVFLTLRSKFNHLLNLVLCTFYINLLISNYNNLT